MSEQFYDLLTRIMTNRQMSISSIARELKKNGYDHHRLILTGYLRALHDTGYLEEVDIPPSKVYTFRENPRRDIYALLKDQLANLDGSDRMDIAVFLLSSLFLRPCFKCELELLGIEARKTDNVKESKDERLRGFRASVTRIHIPPDDPGFEMKGENTVLLARGNEILINVVSELVDLGGLRARYQQTKLA